MRWKCMGINYRWCAKAMLAAMLGAVWLCVTLRTLCSLRQHPQGNPVNPVESCLKETLETKMQIKDLFMKEINRHIEGV